MAHKTSRIVHLSGSPFTTRNAADDVRGRPVVDADGHEVGEVDELMMDEDERRVRLLRVCSGGFMGIGAATFLIPVDAVTKVAEDAVYINRPRDHVAAALAYDPQIIPEDDYLEGLYGHYGHHPFWTPGYAYPDYPYYL